MADGLSLQKRRQPIRVGRVAARLDAATSTRHLTGSFRSRRSLPRVIIACATDRRFLQPAGVMLASLFDRGDIAERRVIVFGYRLRPPDKVKLRQSSGTGSDTIEFIDIDSDSPLLRGLLPSNLLTTAAVYSRLLIPELLPEETGRLLYLDCDLVVRGSLRPLEDMELDGMVLGAVEEHSIGQPAATGHLPQLAELPYFNAGVLLIELSAWRRMGLTRAALELERQHHFRFADQDALNLELAGKWKKLERKWNFMFFPGTDSEVPPDSRIIHFAGKSKPWHQGYPYPGGDLYLRYRSLTPWRHHRLTSRFERRMGKLLEKRRRRLRRYWEALTS